MGCPNTSPTSPVLYVTGNGPLLICVVSPNEVHWTESVSLYSFFTVNSEPVVANSRLRKKGNKEVVVPTGSLPLYLVPTSTRYCLECRPRPRTGNSIGGSATVVGNDGVFDRKVCVSHIAELVLTVVPGYFIVGGSGSDGVSSPFFLFVKVARQRKTGTRKK